MEVTIKKNGQKGPCVTVTAGQKQSSDIQVVSKDSTVASNNGETTASDTDGPARTHSSVSEASSPTWLTTEPVHEDSCQYFQRHGLGRAVDSTKKCPWKSRTAHQFKKVEMSNLVENDDGNSVHSFSLQVGNYSLLQNGFEASITAPKVPVRVGVAADACRTTDCKKLVKGRSIHKRTIVLKLMDTDEPCEFVKEINKLKGKERSVAIEECKRILHEYGNVTHFISAITLGAMEYSVEEYRENNIAGKVGGSIGVDSFVTLKNGTSYKYKRSEKSTFDQKVGRMNKEDQVLQEGVIQYECTSIAALVKDEECSEYVTDTVKLYMIEKKMIKKGIHGPYLIHYKRGREKKYWKIIDPDEKREQVTQSAEHASEKRVQLTRSAEDASKFFIERDHRGVQAEFMIATSKNGKSSSYPHSPQYIHLSENTTTNGWSLIVGPLFRKRSSKSMTERFEVYYPKAKKSSLTADSHWFPESVDSEEGEGCYLKPQLDWMFKQLQDKFMSPRYLHYDKSGSISLDKLCFRKAKSMQFVLTDAVKKQHLE